MVAAVPTGGNELRSSARLQKKSWKNRATTTRLPNALAEEIPNTRGDVMCVRCIGGFSPSNELDEVRFRSVDWGDSMESQLRELLLGCLDFVYRDAVKRIATCGYSDDLATEAVLASGVSYRSKEGGGGGRNLLGDALSILRDGGSKWLQTEHFKFIHCIEKLVVDGKSKEWETCFQSISRNPHPVKHCFYSGLGKHLELHYAEETDALEPPRKFVPWVVVDGRPLYEGYENFETEICKAYKGERPQACEKFALKVSLRKKKEALHACYAGDAEVHNPQLEENRFIH